MSTAASRAKYLYKKRACKKDADCCISDTSILEEICRLRVLKAGLIDDLGDPIRCCINRKEYIGKDEKYIKALEDSNKVLNSENRRLINLLTQYQKIIGIGVEKIYHETKIKGLSV